jgi:hypothetical protein
MGSESNLSSIRMESKVLLVLCGVLLSLSLAQSESCEQNVVQRMGERRQIYSGERFQDQTATKVGHQWGEKLQTVTIQRDGQDWTDKDVLDMVESAKQRSEERQEIRGSNEQRSSEEKVLYGRCFPRDKVATKTAHAEK